MAPEEVARIAGRKASEIKPRYLSGDFPAVNGGSWTDEDAEAVEAELVVQSRMRAEHRKRSRKAATRKWLGVLLFIAICLAAGALLIHD